MNDERRGYVDGQRAPVSDRTRPSAALIGLLIVIALFVIFFFQNSKKTKIDFLFVDKTTTVRWSLLVAVILGIIIDRIFTIWWRHRGRRNNT